MIELSVAQFVALVALATLGGITILAALIGVTVNVTKGKK